MWPPDRTRLLSISAEEERLLPQLFYWIQRKRGSLEAWNISKLVTHQRHKGCIVLLVHRDSILLHRGSILLRCSWSLVKQIGFWTHVTQAKHRPSRPEAAIKMTTQNVFKHLFWGGPSGQPKYLFYGGARSRLQSKAPSSWSSKVSQQTHGILVPWVRQSSSFVEARAHFGSLSPTSMKQHLKQIHIGNIYIYIYFCLGFPFESEPPPPSRSSKSMAGNETMRCDAIHFSWPGDAMQYDLVVAHAQAMRFMSYVFFYWARYLFLLSIVPILLSIHHMLTTRYAYWY